VLGRSTILLTYVRTEKASSWSEKNNTTKGRLLFILLDMKNYYYIVIF